MKKINILLIALLSLGFVSCISDDSSQGDYNSVSQISLGNAISENYTVNQFSTLTIDPQIAQTNTQKEVSYEWQINYETVSTNAVLSYECLNLLNAVPCRLRVSNGDEIKYYNFNLTVQGAFSTGLYILSDYQNKATMSYLPVDADDKSFILDAFGSAHSATDLGTNPVGIAYMRYAAGWGAGYDVPLLYVATGNPTSLRIVLPDSVYVRATRILTSEAKWIKNAQTSTSYDGPLFVNVNNVIQAYTASSSSISSYPTTYDFRTALNLNSIDLANAATTWYNATGMVLSNNRDAYYYWANYNGVALFDNSEGRLLGVLTNIASSSANKRELLSGTFSGDSLIGMGAVDMGRNLVLFTRNKTTGDYHFTRAFPGYWMSTTNTANNTAPSVLAGPLTITESATGINAQTVVATAPTRSFVYYSSGNRVHAFSALAINSTSTSFPTTSSFTVGDSNETIVQLLVNRTGTRLYIATNSSANTDLPGSVYCYDIDNNTLLWSQRNITGAIKQMTYRDY